MSTQNLIQLVGECALVQKCAVVLILKVRTGRPHHRQDLLVGANRFQKRKCAKSSALHENPVPLATSWYHIDKALRTATFSLHRSDPLPGASVINALEK